MKKYKIYYLLIQNSQSAENMINIYQLYFIIKQMGGDSSKQAKIIQQNFPVTIKEGFFMFGNTSKGSIMLKYTPEAIKSLRTQFKFPRYAHCFMGSGSFAYMTGGVEELQSTSAQLKSIDEQEYEGLISKKFFKISVANLFNPTSHDNPFPYDSAFIQLPEMINARYAHCALQNNNDVYVFGGREYGDDQIGILAACEKYVHSEGKWKSLPTMRYSRSGAGAVFYGEHIYVFGGYTGKNQRSRVIQSYRDGDNSWRQLSYRLHEGLQGFLIIANPVSSSSLYIFGGKTDSGKSNSVFELNFDKSSVQYCKPMKQQRCFHKGYVFNKKVHLVGGGAENVQIYNLIEEKSKIDQELSFIEHCNSRQLSSITALQPQIRLSFAQKPYSSPQYDKKLFIFGHSKQPFTKIIDLDKFVVISQPQSLNHNFYKFPTVIKVNKEACFVLGGISADYNKVTSMAYSFNIKTQEVKYLQSMKTAKYGFTGAVKGSYLYIVGGRKLGGDEVAILSSCQRFSFQNYQWESIASLKYKRHSALVTVVKGWLLVVGGYRGGGVRSNEMEMYIQEDNRWVEIQQRFEMAAEAITPISYQNSIYIFGGKVGDSDIQKVFKFNITLNQGMKYQKCITMGLEVVGNLSAPGNSLKIFVDTHKKLAYIIGNVEKGIDVYDLKKHKIVQMEKLPVFESLQDPFFSSYSIVF